MSWQQALSPDPSAEYKEVAYAALPSGARRILDVGCGSGDDVLLLAERLGSQVLLVGIDWDAAAIEEAARKARNVALSVRFAVGDARYLAFGDESFDLVRADHLLGACAELPRVLGELVRVLAPGGRLLLHDAEAALVGTGEASQGDVLGTLRRLGLAELSIAGSSHGVLSVIGYKARRHV